MFLEEILAGREVSIADVAAWAADAFGIPRDAVVVESEDDRGGTLSESVEMLIEVGRLAGEFPAHLSLFARSPRTESAERAALVEGFAERFDSHVLVSDTSLDPYRMTEILPDGSRRLVRLVAEALDDRDAYVIAGPYAPDDEDMDV